MNLLWPKTILIFSLATYASMVLSMDGLSKTSDCTKLEIEVQIDPSRSREENLERLTQEFYEALNQVEHCNDGSGGGSAGAGGGTSGSGASGENMTGSEGTASSSIQGTSPKLSDQTKVETTDTQTGSETNTSESETDVEQAVGNVSSPQPSSNGKVPDDIPPADNDSIFAAQIRAAAEAETDPVTRAKLWNEYRKYKGLPERSLSE